MTNTYTSAFANLTLEAATLAGTEEPVLTQYKEVRKLSEAWSRFKRNEDLTKLLNYAKTINIDDMKVISEMLGFNFVATNISDNAAQLADREKHDKYRERGLKITSAEKQLPQRFDEMLEDIFQQCGEDEDKFVGLMAGLKQDLFISLTDTIHPVVNRSDFMWKLHSDLAHQIEDESLTEDRKQSIKDQFTKAMQAVLAGEESIVPYKQVSVSTEAEFGAHSLAGLKEVMQTAREQYNAAIDRFIDAKKISKDSLPDLHLSKEQTQLTTWGGGFDADGRTHSTSQLLHNTVMNEDNPLYGITGDARQNSAVHRNTLSAIIQKAYSREKYDGSMTGFHDLCEEFIEATNSRDKKWKSPTQSPYLLLNGDRAEFARRLLGTDYELVPAFIKASTVPVCEAFWEEFNGYLAENGLDPKATLQDLDDMYFDKSEGKKYTNRLNEFRDRFEAREISFEMPDGSTETRKFKLDKALHYRPNDNMIGSNWLQNTHKLKDGKLIENNEADRAVIADSVKRLLVLKHAIEQNPDRKVVDRLEIANFEEPAHFYETLILMKETGLVKIENGIVTEPPLIGICPLLETVEDLDNAKATFTKLLEDPLVLSYYKQRGFADIMLGFSDGAKSGGNLKAQRAIHNGLQDLVELFESKGISMRGKEGRGHGKDRGGLDELGISRDLFPDNYTKNAVFDQTVQADLPLHMATHRKTYGERQAGSIIEGTIRDAARIRLEEGAKQSPEIVHRNRTTNKAIDFLADLSDAYFQEAVRKNPQMEKLLDYLQYNADISSRSKSRDADDKGIPDYEDIRAIPVEFKPAVIAMAIHNIGLNTAMDDLMQGNKEVKIGDQTFNCQKILEEMTDAGINRKDLMQDKFFNAFVRQQESNLSNLEPEFVMEYLKDTEFDGYAHKLLLSLTGIQEDLSLLTGNYTQAKRLNPVNDAQIDKTAARAMLNALEKSGEERPSMDIEHHGKIAQTVRNLVGVISDNFSSKPDQLEKSSDVALAA